MERHHHLGLRGFPHAELSNFIGAVKMAAALSTERAVMAAVCDDVAVEYDAAWWGRRWPDPQRGNPSRTQEVQGLALHGSCRTSSE